MSPAWRRTSHDGLTPTIEGAVVGDVVVAGAAVLVVVLAALVVVAEVVATVVVVVAKPCRRRLCSNIAEFADGVVAQAPATTAIGRQTPTSRRRAEVGAGCCLLLIFPMVEWFDRPTTAL